MTPAEQVLAELRAEVAALAARVAVLEQRRIEEDAALFKQYGV